MEAAPQARAWESIFLVNFLLKFFSYTVSPLRAHAVSRPFMALPSVVAFLKYS